MSSNANICNRKWPHAHGSSRSLVRQIGSRLPINTTRNVYIELPSTPVKTVAEESSNFFQSSGQEGLSLAAACWKGPGKVLYKAANWMGLEPITEDEGGKEGEGGGVTAADGDGGDGGEGLDVEEEMDRHTNSQDRQETLQKISTLESQLAHLKAQIALYAIAESEETMADETDAPPPPPPPLPPPPPPPTAQTPHIPHSKSILDPRHNTGGAGTAHQRHTHSTPKQDFSAVLKDIGSIKLRTAPVARSPGGTPFRRVRENTEAADNDPGAIIAQALRRKFAHRVFQDSPDKENLDQSSNSSVAGSGFGTPNTKLFNN